MTDKSIRIEKEGVYLFPAPNLLRISLDRELLVVFQVQMPKTCGLVIFDPRSSGRDFTMALDTVWNKLVRDHRASPGGVQLKVFGMSRGDKIVVRQLYKWVTEKKLMIASEDTGRDATRLVLVDCGSGLVGVSYAEAHTPGVPLLMTTGSARQRFSEDAPTHHALVLSANPVHRQLARQVIEDNRGWLAHAPVELGKLLSSRVTKKFPWRVVLVCDDMAADRKLTVAVGKWIAQAKKLTKDVIFLFAGDNLPASTRRHGQELPAIDPAEMSDIKGAYGEALGWATGSVLRMPARARKKSGRG